MRWLRRQETSWWLFAPTALFLGAGFLMTRVGSGLVADAKEIRDPGSALVLLALSDASLVIGQGFLVLSTTALIFSAMSRFAAHKWPLTQATADPLAMVKEGVDRINEIAEAAGDLNAQREQIAQETSHLETLLASTEEQRLAIAREARSPSKTKVVAFLGVIASLAVTLLLAILATELDTIDLLPF